MAHEPIRLALFLVEKSQKKAAPRTGGPPVENQFPSSVRRLLGGAAAVPALEAVFARSDVFLFPFHRGLFECLALADFRKNACLLDLLFETLQGGLKRVPFTNYDSWHDFTPFLMGF
jgi:hypothetical protein